MQFARETMSDLTTALSVTVLSSTAGLALASVLPPTELWTDPRFWAPICSAAVNGVWLLWRIWKRRQHQLHRRDDVRDVRLALAQKKVRELEAKLKQKQSKDSFPR